MYRVSSLPSARRLHLAWVVATMLGAIVGFEFGIAVWLIWNLELLNAIFVTLVCFSLIGVAQAGALFWWQRSLGRQLVAWQFIAWWAVAWMLGGCVFIFASFTLDLLGPAIAVLALISMQSWRLNQPSWFLSSCGGCLLSGVALVIAIIIVGATLAQRDPHPLFLMLAGVVVAGLPALAYGMMTGHAISKLLVRIDTETFDVD